MSKYKRKNAASMNSEKPQLYRITSGVPPHEEIRRITMEHLRRSGGSPWNN